MSERDLEEDYFARQDREKLEKMRQEKAEADAAQALADRKAQHWNKCGKCGADMITKGYRGVEIEICPDCGAVLLDHGELQTLAGEDQGGVVTGLLSIFSRGS